MNIGILGGSSLCVVGTTEDIEAFFERARSVKDRVGGKTALITDRLYRRYLRISELDEASAILKVMVSTLLGPHADMSESEICSQFLRCFNQGVESAKLNYEAFKATDGYEYEPVRLVIADQPWFTAEKNRSLAEYDSLQGRPFWAGPE